MQKVYLLLRNNQQTGPHTLEELLQKELKPQDLIWVEGRSAGWSYPSEIDIIKPYLHWNTMPVRPEPATEPPPAIVTPQEAKRVVSQKVFVSMPVKAPAVAADEAPRDAIEEKAEALRKKIQSYATTALPEEGEIKTNYSRALHSVEDDYTSWIYQKKTKKKGIINKKGLAVLGVVLAGLAGGWWIATAMFRQPVAGSTKPQVTQTVLKAEESGETRAVPEELSTEIKGTAYSSSGKKAAVPVTKTTREKRRAPAGGATKEPALATPQHGAIAVEPEPPSVQKESPAVATEKVEPAVVENPKEKRTLKTLFHTLFKKNKKSDPSTEEPRPAENTNKERIATHRNEEAAGSVTTMDISDQVTVKSNKNAEEEWMTGVQGLKLTLFNQSGLVLQTAVVEVLYYSEQKDLLYKRSLQFSNVAPRKSQTLPAPDHRLADHVEFKIISAIGIDNAYANR